MSEKKTNRRDFLFTATYAVGAVGVGVTIWPMIDQMNPDATALALSKIEVDISQLERGQAITVKWRGKPVFIRKRTEEEISKARKIMDQFKKANTGLVVIDGKLIERPVLREMQRKLLVADKINKS